ncbi:MAG TPA: GYD domain-containing protein [Streptosporangiaceae bacterium]|nr:GYD domain-containing protein [Streptosporangiaceae bacterium]
MSKYITSFTYSNGSWARMISSPGDRTKAARRTLESLGGSLECLYWQLASHDGFAISDLPDTVSAYAVTSAVAKTGAFKSVETHELFTQKQFCEILCLARDIAEVYEAPGQVALGPHR